MATNKDTTHPRREKTADAIRKENRHIQQSLRYLEDRARDPGELLNDTKTAALWFRLRLGDRPAEVFAAAWLNRDHRLIGFQELFHGTIDSVDVPLREVVRCALQFNASAVLFAHNHPSGNIRPSYQDILVTTQLVEIFHVMKIKVLDHFIITAGASPFSMAQAHLVMGGRLGPGQTRYRKAA